MLLECTLHGRKLGPFLGTFESIENAFGTFITINVHYWFAEHEYANPQNVRNANEHDG